MTWEQIPSSYDAVASEYEATFLDELDGKPQDQAMLSDFIEATTGPIADLGCGPGQIGHFVRSRGRTVVGVDISAEMAKLASGRLDGALVSDMRRLPFGGDHSAESLPSTHSSTFHDRRWARRSPRSAGFVEEQEFLGQAVPFVATLFSLDELTDATRNSGLNVTMSQRREPLESEHQTGRLYVAAERPRSAG